MESKMTLHKPMNQDIIKEGSVILTTLEEKKQYVQKFNVFDDSFFEMVAKDKDAVEDILRIILHDPKLVVTKSIPQNSVKNLYEFFKNSQGQNDKFHRLTNRVHDLKNNESEVTNMCKLVEDFAKEYAKEYAKEQKKILICDLVRKGALSAENGAEQLELSLEDFRNLLNEAEQEIVTPA